MSRPDSAGGSQAVGGETDLGKLLAGMRASLAPDTFVFATLPPREPIPAGLDPLMMFREREGTTLILTEAAAAEAGIAAGFRCRQITLEIHSALEAVGFIAAIAAHLAAAGMGVNPVAGYYHDHLFVPADRAEDAMTLLDKLAQQYR